MTANEFVKTRDWKYSRAFMSTMGTLVLLLLLGAAINFRFPLPATLIALSPGVVFAAIVLAYYLAGSSMEKFVKAHPEMHYVDDWKAVVGNLDEYPTTKEECMAAREKTIALLSNLERVYWGACRVVTDFREAADHYAPETPEATAAEAALATANMILKARNGKCDMMFGLYVAKLKIIIDCPDRTEFHKMFMPEKLPAAIAG